MRLIFIIYDVDIGLYLLLRRLMRLIFIIKEIDDEVCEITATETELGVTVTTTVATLHTVPR